MGVLICLWESGLVGMGAMLEVMSSSPDFPIVLEIAALPYSNNVTCSPIMTFTYCVYRVRVTVVAPPWYDIQTIVLFLSLGSRSILKGGTILLV